MIWKNKPQINIIKGELIRKVINFNDLDELGRHLTKEISDVSGAKFVVMVQADQAIQSGYTVIGKSPNRLRFEEKLNIIYQITTAGKSLLKSKLVEHIPEKSEISGLLQKLGGEFSILTPLRSQNNYLGLLLMIDIASKTNAESLLGMLDILSDILALKLETLHFSQNHKIEIESRSIDLKESEAYNRLLFDKSRTGLLLCSMDGMFVDLNQAFADILGRTIEETVLLSYWDLTPEKYREQEEEQLMELENTGFYGPYEKEYLHKDGHLIPVILQGDIIELHGERFIYSSAEDITERKNAEKKMIESSRRFMGIMKNVKMISLILDSTGKASFCNDYLLELTGYTSNEIIGKNWFKLFLPSEISDEVKTVFDQAIKNADDLEINFENEILAKNGERLLVSWKNTLLLDLDGNITGIASLGEEITEKRQHEIALKKSEAKFRSLVESSSDIIWEIDSNRVYSYISPQVEKILGFEVSEVLNRYPHEFVIDADKEDFIDYSNVVVQSGKSFRKLRCRFMHKNKSYVYLDIHGNPIFDTNGKLTGYVGISRVISPEI